MEAVMKLTGNNDSLKGSFEGDGGEVDIDGISIVDGGLKLEFELDMNGTFVDGVINAKSEGDNKLVGKWAISGDDGNQVAEGDWSATREPKGLAGVWNVVAAVPNSGDYEGTLTLEMKDGKYSGTSKGDDREVEIQSVKVGDKTLTFTTPFERDGNTGTITVEAKQKEDGSLEGEWVLKSDGGQEFARDSWKATRK